MNKEKAQNFSKIRLIVLIILLLIIILGLFLVVYFVKYEKYKKDGMLSIFNKIETTKASLTEYIVYGTHLNIKGEINQKLENVSHVNLVFSYLDGTEKKLKLDYEELDSKITFSTSDLINMGIDLEDLAIDKHYLLIEVEYGKRKKNYYSIENKTKYDEVLYYTITKEHSNNKINIKFDEYKHEKINTSYMVIEVKKAKLPKEVYDIVIDPGHGGSDTGAKYGGYEEDDLTLEYGKKVKKELEKLGLKVKITRDGTEDEEKFGTQTVYDKNGRVNIVGLSKAKYVFSIHLNSITEANSQSGVEIYVPAKTDLTFAKLFAQNIVKYANTKYSNLEASYKVSDGVYARTFKDFEIEESIQEAIKKGYEPYNITTDTPYLYMLRETGGIATKAYVDGRNTGFGSNMFVNSNIGVEAFLLELGYLNNDEELQKLVNEKDNYVDGIVASIKEWLKS